MNENYNINKRLLLLCIKGEPRSDSYFRHFLQKNDHFYLIFMCFT